MQHVGITAISGFMLGINRRGGSASFSFRVINYYFNEEMVLVEEKEKKMTSKTDKNIKDILNGSLKFSFEEWPKVEDAITVGDFLKTWYNELKENQDLEL